MGVPIDVDVTTLLNSNQVLLIAPIIHPTKGEGVIHFPISREFLDDLSKTFGDIIDDAERHHMNADTEAVFHKDSEETK